MGIVLWKAGLMTVLRRLRQELPCGLDVWSPGAGKPLSGGPRFRAHCGVGGVEALGRPGGRSGAKRARKRPTHILLKISMYFTQALQGRCCLSWRHSLLPPSYTKRSDCDRGPFQHTRASYVLPLARFLAASRSSANREARVKIEQSAVS